jgi:hypothetical protein
VVTAPAMSAVSPRCKPPAAPAMSGGQTPVRNPGAIPAFVLTQPPPRPDGDVVAAGCVEPRS